MPGSCSGCLGSEMEMRSNFLYPQNKSGVCECLQIPSKHSQPDVKKAKKQMLVFNQTLTCFSAFALLFNILFRIYDELLPFFSFAFSSLTTLHAFFSQKCSTKASPAKIFFYFKTFNESPRFVLISTTLHTEEDRAEKALLICFYQR